MSLWFTSDPHYYHRNVIRLCRRPFASQEEMHEELIRRWHASVEDGDTVYVLGDFAFCGIGRAREIVSRLRGNKRLTLILVMGNHDGHRADKYLQIGFDQVFDEDCTLYWAGRKLTLSHYPYRPSRWDTWMHRLGNFWKFWKRIRYKELRYLDRRPVDDGRWLLHGHVHNAWKTKRRMINVGVDAWNFRPVNIREIAAIIRAKEG